MNKRFISILKFIPYSFLLIFFAACSDFSRQTGSASFTISKSVLREVANSRSILLRNEASFAEGSESEETEESGEKLLIRVSVYGDYNQTKEADVFWDDSDSEGQDSASVRISFDELPIGAEISAKAELISVAPDGTEYVKYSGESESTVIKAGNNDLYINLKYAEPVVPEYGYLIQFYFEQEDDDGTASYVCDSSYDTTGTYSDDEAFRAELKEKLLKYAEVFGTYELNEEKTEENFDSATNTLTVRLYFDIKEVNPIEEEYGYLIQFYFEQEDDDGTASYVYDSSYDTTGTYSDDEAFRAELEEKLLKYAEVFVTYELNEEKTEKKFDSATNTLTVRLYFDIKESEPAEETTIRYALSLYSQKDGTTYDEDKDIKDQTDIFELRRTVDSGTWKESESTEKYEAILNSVQDYSIEGYEYCGYTYSVDSVNLVWNINFYYKQIVYEPEVHINISIILESVETTLPDDLSVDIAEEDGNQYFKAPEGYEDYSWCVDGVIVNDTNGNPVTASELVLGSTDKNELEAGVHTISVTVTASDGSKYNTNASFIVEL